MIKYSNRTLSRKNRILPSFIIIGAGRSGTTSLYAYLISHPNVLPAAKKETVFFNYVYHKNLDWYRMYFPTIHELKRTKKFTSQNVIISGEATPSYLIDPLVPKRISYHLPNVKLIVLLRNPIERALSHYYHNIFFGIEKLSFEKAIQRENERINKSYAKLKDEKIVRNKNFISYFFRLLTFKTKNYFNFSYLETGKYYEHLKNWGDLFPKKQLMIIKSEDLFNESKDVFKQVQEFLGLPYHDIKQYGRHWEIKHKPMDDELRKNLQKFYEPYNSKLYECLDRDFRWS